MDEARFQVLLAAARAAQANAHAPYSGFRVGAAVAARSGATYAGCNVENASYPVSMCAERGAISAAIAAGETAIDAVVIVSPAPEPCPPCGMCRQALAEFGLGMEVVSVAPDGRRRSFVLSELLPETFGPEFFRPGATATRSA